MTRKPLEYLGPSPTGGAKLAYFMRRNVFHWFLQITRESSCFRTKVLMCAHNFLIPDAVKTVRNRKRRLLMKKRKCVKCGASLTDEDVMKIKIEDGSWETIPLPVCPNCFKKQMRERVSR
jgi:hypothetical protein